MKFRLTEEEVIDVLGEKVYRKSIQEKMDWENRGRPKTWLCLWEERVTLWPGDPGRPQRYSIALCKNHLKMFKRIYNNATPIMKFERTYNQCIGCKYPEKFTESLDALKRLKGVNVT